MKISDAMTRDVATVRPETTLKEVARLLTDRRISGVPVVDGSGRVVGVVSEADIVAKETGREGARTWYAWLLPPEPPLHRADARTAAEAMSAPAITVEPDRELAVAARTMSECAVNRLPVVDHEGRLVGIVTRTDLVRAFLRPDAEIERELREDVALGVLWIDPERLSVEVREGVVTLAGELDTRWEARMLERFARRTPGVVTVESRLTWRMEEARLPQSDPHVPIVKARG